MECPHCQGQGSACPGKLAGTRHKTGTVQFQPPPLLPHPSLRPRDMCIYTCAHVRVCTSQYMLPPTGTRDCLSFPCQDELPGSHLSVSEWVADLGSQRFPVPGGLHDTTPTSAFRHLSRSMEIEHTTSGCWVSQHASRQSL